jgi:hypothetical protein
MHVCNIGRKREEWVMWDADDDVVPGDVNPISSGGGSVAAHVTCNTGAC